MCPLHRVRFGRSAASFLPGCTQEAPDLRDTFSALGLAVKATEQRRYGADAAGGELVDLPFG
jgi:hypothetical protein